MRHRIYCSMCHCVIAVSAAKIVVYGTYVCGPCAYQLERDAQLHLGASGADRG